MEKLEKRLKRGQILSIVQWFILFTAAGLVSILMPLLTGQNGWWGWLFPISMAIIHSCEAFMYGFKVGDKYGYTKLESLCLTWLYGFTWWKYKKELEEFKEKTN